MTRVIDYEHVVCESIVRPPNSKALTRLSDYDLTLIIPVYNEEDNMERLVQTVSSYLPCCPRRACALFVNDGSTDQSLRCIREACRREGLFYISWQRNRGLSAALKAGIDTAQSPLVAYMDADMQTDIRDLSLLLQHADDYPLVCGIRANRRDTFSKRFQSRFANGFRRMMTHDGATDTGCPLKVMQTAYAKRLPLFTGMHRFLPALILLQEGGAFKELPVRHYPRQAGTSKFSVWNRLLGPLQDCFAYRWMKTRYINYTISESNLP